LVLKKEGIICWAWRLLLFVEVQTSESYRIGEARMSTKRKTGQSGIALLQSRSSAMLDEAQKRDISIAYRAALVAMTNDRGTEQLWHTLACALSIAGVMLELKLCSETKQIILDAQDALIKAGAVSRSTGKWAIGSGEMIIRAGLTALDRQMEVATVAQVSAAMKRVLTQVS
jgi:hypothetical protein